MNIELDPLLSPVFVVGPLRSGTTLLRLMLDHHPDMNFFGEFETAVSQGKRSGWPDIKDFHEFIRSDRQTLAHNFYVDESLPYEALIKDFLRQAYEKKPRHILGASIHSRMDLLPTLWPQARFIHLLRDPRDVARSCIGMGWVGNVYEGAPYWSNVEEHWEYLTETVPSAQLLTIRYEDLVTNPEVELTRICDFLGLEYSPDMLNLEKDTSYARPNAKYANQWKSKLSDREKSWVEYRCAELMKKRAYALATSADKPSPLELLYIKIQNRLYRVKFNVIHWGFVTWLLFVSAKKLGLSSLQKRMQLKINKTVENRLR